MKYKTVHDAVKQADIESVAKMVKEGASINEVDANGLTPMHWAANVGSVEWLLWRKADPLVVNKMGWTAMHIAAIRGHEACIQSLIAHNLSVSTKDTRGATPGHMACIHGNSYSLQFLLRAGCDLDTIDDYGWTMLHAAAYHGRLGCVQILMKWGLHFDQTDNMGNTSAHLAAMEGHLSVLQYIVSISGNVNFVLDARNDNGETPKTLAEQFFKQPVVDYIDSVLNSSQGPFEDDVLNQLAFPAHAAAYRGDSKCLQALIENGVVKVNERDEQNSTPLHKAAAQGHSHIVQWLVEFGANPTLANDGGETAADVARRFGQLAVLYQLCPNADELEMEALKRMRLAKKSITDGDIEETELPDQQDEEVADLLEDISPSLLDIDLPFGDCEGDAVQLSEQRKSEARTRAHRRIKKLERLMDLAQSDFRLLGGQPSEAERAEQRKYREMERRVEELEGELEYERTRRERLEAQLDEAKREINVLNTRLHSAYTVHESNDPILKPLVKKTCKSAKSTKCAKDSRKSMKSRPCSADQRWKT